MTLDLVILPGLVSLTTLATIRQMVRCTGSVAVSQILWIPCYQLARANAGDDNMWNWLRTKQLPHKDPPKMLQSSLVASI